MSLLQTDPARPDSLAADDPQAAVAPGDRLLDGMEMDVEEFLRRYEVVEQQTGVPLDAELIFGVVSVYSPPDFSHHSVPSSNLVTVVSVYRSKTVGTTSGTEGRVQPPKIGLVGTDGSLAILPEYGGQMTRRSDGRLDGVPELCIEIANTSLRTDTTVKRQFYEQAGVREYLVHDVRGERLLFYRRQGETLVEDTTGDEVIRSETFPGLWFDRAALVAGDLTAALETLAEGTATPQHAAFVAELASRRQQD